MKMKKIMNTPVQLSIQEILTVSCDIAGYLHDQTKKHQIPIEEQATIPVSSIIIHMTTVASPISYVNI